MKHQKILIMTTSSNSMRSKAEGWSMEDSSLVNKDQREHIGLTPYKHEFHAYDCPLRALANGWRLLAPPTEYTEAGLFVKFEWWFEKFTEPQDVDC